MLGGKRPDIGEMGIGDELQLGRGPVRRPVAPNTLRQSRVGPARTRVFIDATRRIEQCRTGNVAGADELFPRPSQRRISLGRDAVRELAAVDHSTTLAVDSRLRARRWADSPAQLPGLPPERPITTTAHLEWSNDEDNFVRRSVSLDPDGTLRIEGHDMGAGPEAFWGDTEYEFERTVRPGDVERLRDVLGLGTGDDLIAVLAARFNGSGGSLRLEQLLKAEGIPSEFWSRIGH